MLTPQQQIIDRCKTIFAKVSEIYQLDMGGVDIRFDLKGRAAGMACRRNGKHYYMRFNADMLKRDAFDHVITDTVPHEIAHIVCFMNPKLGSNHDAGWVNVCRILGGTGTRCHKEEVVYGKGATYEYTTTHGHQVRVSQTMHKRILNGTHYTYKNNKGKIDKTCAHTIVGVAGRTLASAVPVVAPKVIAPVVPVAPIRVPTFFIGAPEVKTVKSTMTKADMARAIIAAGQARGDNYETMIAAIMAKTGHTRQLAKVYYAKIIEKQGK